MGRLLGVLELALLYIQLELLFRELRLPKPTAIALLSFGVLLNTPFVLSHLGVAQMSMLIAFGTFLGWYWWRHDRELLAGVALGLTCTLKFFPAALIFLMLFYRRWRGVAAAAIAWLSVAGFMTWRLGLASWHDYSKHESDVVDLWIAHASNATLHGVMTRVFHPACVADTFRDPRATAVALAASVALLILFLWTSRRLIQRGRIDLPYALFIILSLLANVFYWEHYSVTLILPFALAAYYLTKAYRSGLSRGWTGTAAAALALAASCTCIAPNSARVLLYIARSRPQIHLRAHLTEIGTALPPFVIGAVLLGLTAWYARKEDNVGESGRLTSAETPGSHSPR